jgi:hypothetical protein
MPRSPLALPGGARVADFISLGVLSERITGEAVRSCVEDSGRTETRRRSLPADVTALFVVAMSLYRDVSYEEIVSCLAQGFRWLKIGGPRSATKGAVTQARIRLGSEPMRLLFTRLCHPVADKKTKGAWYRSWRTVALDGSTLDLVDSPANAEAYGCPGSSRGTSASPQIRFAALLETGTHAPFAAQFGPYATGETTLARSLLPDLKPGMLLLADRGFFGYDLFTEAARTGADLLFRVRSNQQLPVERRLKDGSYLSRIYPHPNERRKQEGGFVVRVIEYKIEGRDESYRLLTTIVEATQSPAVELARLYHERWEIEVAYDEIKAHLKGSHLPLRSKTPELVEQEFWGLMICHWAIRDLIHQASKHRSRDPDEISFVAAVRVVKRTLPERAALSPLEGQNLETADPR